MNKTPFLRAAVIVLVACLVLGLVYGSLHGVLR